MATRSSQIQTSLRKCSDKNARPEAAGSAPNMEIVLLERFRYGSVSTLTTTLMTGETLVTKRSDDPDTTPVVWVLPPPSNSL